MTDLDIRYVPHRRGGVDSRLRHVVIETATVRTARGTRVPNLPWIAGNVGSAFAQQRWEQGETQLTDAALSAAISMGIDLAVNAVTEFTAAK